jgi:carbon monoxide dehydrogenase subunit G
VHFEQTIEIAAPPERVWQVLTDVERWPEWARSTRSLTFERGDRIAVGARAKIGLAGSMAATAWEVTALDEGRSFVWESRQPGLRNVAGHYVEPSGAGTRVKLTIDISGPLGALMRPYLAYVTRRNVGWEIEGLKQRSEALAGG